MRQFFLTSDYGPLLSPNTESYQTTCDCKQKSYLSTTDLTYTCADDEVKETVQRQVQPNFQFDHAQDLKLDEAFDTTTVQ